MKQKEECERKTQQN